MELFRLLGVIALEGQKETEKGLDTVTEKANKVSESILKGISTFAKWSAAAASAATAVAGVLVKSAVQSYAEYEQLVGGVETLFKDSQDTVMKYANNAFKTAGLSANEYMETVTSFSASLLQSLEGDTQAAAEKADLAITDMSDNANKMGTSIEAIQNAYQGFAKQNYTMLDNLKLGYGGTKEEMQRLLEDAEKLSGQKFDLSSYADIVDAIHVVQTEMGITGTTAKEAASTISGSVNMTKSAWKNLVVGIADDTQDFDTLVNNFVESFTTAGENILPRVETAINGVAKLVQKMMPTVTKMIPKMISDTLPDMINAGVGLITALLEGLLQATPELIPCFENIIDQLLDVLVTNLPLIIDAAIQIIGAIASGIVKALPRIADSAIQIIENLVSGMTKSLPMVLASATDIVVQIANTIIKNLQTIVKTGLDLLLGLADGILEAIPGIIEVLPELIDNIIDTILSMIPQIIETGVELLTSLVDNLPTIISTIVAVLPQIINNIISTLLSHIDEIIQAGIDLLTALIDSLPEIIDTICKALPDIIKGITETLLYNIDKIIDAGIKLLAAIVKNTPEIISRIAKKIPDILDGICDALGEGLGQMFEAGLELFKKLWDGMKYGAEQIFSWISGVFAPGVSSRVGSAATQLSTAHQTSSGNTVIQTSGGSQRLSTGTKVRRNAKGSVVEKGEIAFLEGTGTEAVVPLENNKKWISAVAKDMQGAIYQQSSGSNPDMEKSIAMLNQTIQELPQAIMSAIASGNIKFDVGNREFARLVKAVNNA